MSSCVVLLVCALQPEDGPDTTGPGSAGSPARLAGVLHGPCRIGTVSRSCSNALRQTESVPFTDFEAGAVFACGSRNYKIVCFGNAPPTPIAVSTAATSLALLEAGTRALASKEIRRFATQAVVFLVP